MAGQNVQIPNVEEASAMMRKQTTQVQALLDDMLKTKAALAGIDRDQASNVGSTAIDYVDQMVDLLQKMSEVNEQAQKQFNQFTQALQEVNNSKFSL